MKNIGFIGIGAMGFHMSENLTKGDYQVFAYDSNPQSLENIKNDSVVKCNSLNEVTQNCEIIIMMLPNSSIVEKVIFDEGGIIENRGICTTLIDMSSSYVLSTRDISERLEELDIKLIDAPVSGGVVGAKNAELIIMVGSKTVDFTFVENILLLMGKKVIHLGDVGSGHAMKALNNYLSATSLYATTEVMMMVKELRIDSDVAIETFNQSSGQSFSTKVKYPKYILPRTFDSNFSLRLMDKDINMVKTLSEDMNIPFYLGDKLVELYDEALESGLMDADHTEIIKFFENKSNK